MTSVKGRVCCAVTEPAMRWSRNASLDSESRSICTKFIVLAFVSMAAGNQDGSLNNVDNLSRNLLLSPT